MPDERFFLGRDQSSHWYLVPVVNKLEWEAWTDLPEDDECSWESPEFAKMIDGPYSLTFTDPQ